jgi:MFS family permease
VISFAFSFLFPWLVVLLVIQWVARKVKKPPHGWRLTSILALISGIIALLPVGGLPLARWLIGINANFSFPLVATALNKAWENASGRRLLGSNASMASWIFGLTAGLALYPMALGLGGFDPYVLGWGFSWLFAFLAMVTIALLLMKNRFAVVLIACILGYDLNLLESANLWDYLVDPFFVFFSFGALSNWLIGRMRKAFSGRKDMDSLGRETADTG